MYLVNVSEIIYFYVFIIVFLIISYLNPNNLIPLITYGALFYAPINIIKIKDLIDNSDDISNDVKNIIYLHRIILLIVGLLPIISFFSPRLREIVAFK